MTTPSERQREEPVRPAGSKTVATPEGDNEFAPDQPLEPIAEGQQKTPAIDTNKL